MRSESMNPAELKKEIT